MINVPLCYLFQEKTPSRWEVSVQVKVSSKRQLISICDNYNRCTFHNLVFFVFISISRQTLNVDITSSTFTDANFRYAAGRDGISASVSTPSTGFLGLQVNTRLPSLGARLYSRYAVSIEANIHIVFGGMLIRRASA